VKRLFFTGEIDVYEIGNLEIGYSELGPTIGLNGTLRALRNDMFVRRIKLVLNDNRDSSRHEFEWDVFRNRKITQGREKELTMEGATGFLLATHTPRRIDVQFHDIDLLNEMRQVFFEVHQAWADIITGLGEEERTKTEEEVKEGKDPYKPLFEEFTGSDVYKRAAKNLERMCYWKPGDYSLDIVVQTARPNKQFEKQSAFSLMESEVDAIHLNVDKLLHDICNRPSPHSYFFAYPRYKNLTIM
jgi:hypothetical protein